MLQYLVISALWTLLLYIVFISMRLLEKTTTSTRINSRSFQDMQLCWWLCLCSYFYHYYYRYYYYYHYY